MSSPTQNVTGPVNIDQYTVYSDDDVVGSDAQFYVSATLVLTGGDDVFFSSSFAGPGETRSLGFAKLIAVEVEQAATFVNTGAVAEAGQVTDSGLIRNVGTWTLGAGDEIAGAAGGRFVNVGTFDASAGGVDVISADFIDYGSLAYSGTLELAGANSLVNVSGLPVGITGAGAGVIEVTGGDARFLNATAPTVGRAHGVQGGVISNLIVLGRGARAIFLDNPTLGLGVLQVNDLTLAADTTMVVAANADVLIGNLTGPIIAGMVRGAGELTDGGALSLLDGARLLVSANISEMLVSGRVVADAPNQSLTVDDVALNNGRLVFAGGAINSEIGGQGQVVNVGALNLFSLSPSGAISDDATVANYAQAYVGGYQPVVDITLDTGATLLNQTGADMVFEADGVFNLAGGTLVNDGALSMRSMGSPPIVPSYGTAIISAAVVNNGYIASGAGIEFKNAVTGTGEDGITAVDLQGAALAGVQGEGLIFDAAVGAEQTIAFTDADQSLTLNDLAGFQGVVTGFDAIGVDAIMVGSAWSLLGFVENTAGTGGVLEFTGNGAETGVSLTGAFVTSGFHAATSGDKTTITYAAP